MPQAAHTCAARAGVIYLSKTLATEWAPLNVRVNCIGPGVIETEGFVMYPEEALKRFHQANPMKQRGNAWDVAEAITYLASPAGRRSEEHTSELQSLMRISYAVFCLKKKQHTDKRICDVQQKLQ